MPELSEIIEEYENTKSSFRRYSKIEIMQRSSLNEFQHRFMDIKSDLKPFKSEVNGKWLRMDDKAATAIKSRIALAISRGEVNGYDKLSLNQSEKYAASTPEYKKFLEERAFYKESLVNIQDLRDDCQGYINLCKDYLKDIYG